MALEKFFRKKQNKEMRKDIKELSIIQKMYDLIMWYIPIINRFPRNHKFTLGDRMQNQLYDILEEMILARYEKKKLERLEKINGMLDVLRYQTKLLLDFELINGKRFYHASELINGVGVELGGWIKQQKLTTQS